MRFCGRPFSMFGPRLKCVLQVSEVFVISPFVGVGVGPVQVLCASLALSGDCRSFLGSLFVSLGSAGCRCALLLDGGLTYDPQAGEDSWRLLLAGFFTCDGRL